MLKKEDGFTLIEVMVALVILTLIAIPLFRMFLTSLQTTLNMGEKSVAISIARRLIEEARFDLNNKQGEEMVDNKKYTFDVSVDKTKNPYEIRVTVLWGNGVYSIVTYKGGS